MYRFEYDITEQDYFEFNKFYMLNSKTHKRTILIYRCLGFIISLLAILIFIVANAETGLIVLESILLGIFSILWFSFGKRTYFKKLKKQFSKLKAEDKLPYSEKGTLIFSETEITNIAPNKELKAAFSSITQLAIRNGTIYICCTGGIGYIVPFRIIPDNINIEEFKSFLENKTGLTFK